MNILDVVLAHSIPADPAEGVLLSSFLGRVSVEKSNTDLSFALQGNRRCCHTSGDSCPDHNYVSVFVQVEHAQENALGKSEQL